MWTIFMFCHVIFQIQTLNSILMQKYVFLCFRKFVPKFVFANSLCYNIVHILCWYMLKMRIKKHQRWSFQLQEISYKRNLLIIYLHNAMIEILFSDSYNSSLALCNLFSQHIIWFSSVEQKNVNCSWKLIRNVPDFHWDIVDLSVSIAAIPITLNCGKSVFVYWIHLWSP